MASSKSPKVSVPTLRSLIGQWDGKIASPHPSLFDLVLHHVSWARGEHSQEDGSSLVIFDGSTQGNKNVFMRFSTANVRTPQIFFRPDTMLEIWAKEHGELWTHYVFKLDSQRKPLGLVFAQMFSEFGPRECLPIFGRPKPVELDDMQPVIEEFPDESGEHLFNRSFGRILATLLGLELAINWESGKLDKLSDLEAIGRRVIDEIRELHDG
jgi:hypothetical protein